MSRLPFSLVLDICQAHSSGVLHTELVLPEGAGEWNRAELWNAAEKAEKRKDARTAREWEVALPDELSEAERRELAVRFARGLAAKYGCAIDVALHAPDREGEQRNWHAHLLATTRKVTAGSLTEKCDIELSDAKRLSLGLAPARIEVEAVRQPEGVDHRSLADQREEEIQNGQVEKATELDRAPHVKLGWKVIQVRRALSSDRANQLRQVQAENVQRKAVVLDIGQLRDQLAKRQEEEAASRREAEQKRLLEEVEAVFCGKSSLHREATLKRWRYLDAREVPDVANARAYWEQDQWDADAPSFGAVKRTLAGEDRSEMIAKRERRGESFTKGGPAILAPLLGASNTITAVSCTFRSSDPQVWARVQSEPTISHGVSFRAREGRSRTRL